MNSYEQVDLMRRRSEVCVFALVGKDAAAQWWTSPNKAFDMHPPYVMFAIDPERVYNYLIGHVDAYG